MKKTAKKDLHKHEKNNIATKRLVIISIVVFITILVGLCVFFINQRTHSLPLDAEGIILVPDSPLIIESWQPLLPLIAEKLSVKKITLQIWHSQDELERLLATADKNNIVFAEVSDGFATHILTSKKLVAPIDSSYLLNTTLYDILKTKEHGFDIPFTVDPWFCVSTRIALDEFSHKREYVSLLSVAAKNDFEAAAFLSLISIFAQSVKNEQILHTIEALKKSKYIQKNAFTYNLADSFIFFEDMSAQNAFIPLSFFRTLNTETILRLIISDIPPFNSEKSDALRDAIIADVTTIVVPQSRRFSDQTISLIVKTLVDPSIIYAVARTRNVLPATTNTAVRDYFSDELRNRLHNASELYIPDSLFTTESDKSAKLEELRKYLVSK